MRKKEKYSDEPLITRKKERGCTKNVRKGKKECVRMWSKRMKQRGQKCEINLTSKSKRKPHQATMTNKDRQG